MLVTTGTLLVFLGVICVALKHRDRRVVRRGRLMDDQSRGVAVIRAKKWGPFRSMGPFSIGNADRLQVKPLPLPALVVLCRFEHGASRSLGQVNSDDCGVSAQRATL